MTTTLFDMDGLLIDSEILWHKAEIEIFGSLGVPLNENSTRATKGMFVGEVVDFWFTQYPWSGPTTTDVTAQLLQRVGDLVEEEGVLLPGAVRALDLTSERGPLGLASSTPQALIYRCLDNFGLRDRFNVVHSAEFEPYGKPHPGVFLTTADLMDVSPLECLVFEDSAAGLLAAKAARMRCVAVPALGERLLPSFAIADLVLPSLEELTTGWLDEEFGR